MRVDVDEAGSDQAALGVVDRVNQAATGNYGSSGGDSPDELQVRLAFELTGLGGFGSSVVVERL